MQDIPQQFRDLTLNDFIEKLSSEAPVPGGGSASAVAGSLAASLVAMVAALSENRPRWIIHAAVHAKAKSSGTELAHRLLRIADEDAAAYTAFGAAAKLPKETEEEQGARKRAMERAARIAAEVPMRCIEACLEVAESVELLAARCNLNASSDLLVAGLLAEAAARGAAENVRVNLPAAGDPDWAAATQARADELVARIHDLCQITSDLVTSGASREPVALG